MALRHEDLTPEVRQCMIREFEADDDAGRVYVSPRLTPAGIEAWPQLVREAIGLHNDAWLAAALRAGSYLAVLEQRRSSTGGITMAKVPSNAAETLAEGEFNRLYARGLCAYVVECGGSEVEVCRGKDVKNPRPES